MLQNVLTQLREEAPLIHCITNPISIHDCANVVLATGARPIMAQHPGEVEEITATASALLINLGNITDTRMQSALLSARVATEFKIPIILDAVGVACSSLRKSFAERLIESYNISLIKGNYSEISSLFSGEKTVGIDVSEHHKITKQNVNEHAKRLIEFSRRCKIDLLSTGLADIVASQSRATVISGGDDSLGLITGTGCMVGALCASFASVLSPLKAAVLACSYFAVAAEMADKAKGLGTFAVTLHDSLSQMDADKLEEKLNNLEEIDES